MALALASTATMSIALLLGAVPAGAVVKTVEIAPSTTTTVGLQPRSIALLDGVGTEPEHFANVSGAPVLPANKTYAIYWDPTDHYHGDWQKVTDTFFQNMGAASGSFASVFSVDTQYTDAANQHAAYASTFMGAYTDTDPYPAVGNCTDPHPLEGKSYPTGEADAIACLTNAQIQQELKSFIAAHGLQKGMTTIFYLLTPPGVTVCLDKGKASGHCSNFMGSITETEIEQNETAERKAKEENNPYTGPENYQSYKNSFCSYHANINPDNAINGDTSTILYAAIPWIAGGRGDGHLGPVDQAATEAYLCQDGGFDPSSKPIEQKEKAKEKKIESTKEKEEKTLNKEEKEKQEEEEAKTRFLEGPHQQEPNQQACPPPTPDGFCDTGLADLIVGQIADEQQNIVTNPLLDSWKDPSGNEATDECRDFFAPIAGGSATANPETFAGTLFNQTLAGGNYYLNTAFNLAALKLPYPGIPCLAGIRLEPKFTAPNPVNSSEVVGFDGMESDITLNEGTTYTGTTPQKTYAKYTWNFGDKTPEVTGYAPGAPSLNSPETSPCELPWKAPCAASAFHSYQYSGTYEVTLTVTDTGGNKASVTEPITVNGTPRPVPPPPPPLTPPPLTPGGGSGATPGASSSGSAGSGSTAKVIPGPVATQAVLSHSLSSALKKGLIISYSVNEQVAGQFQVLLASSIAKRIGLHGPAAVGLPAGTPPQTVIAKAILITTKGGHSTVKILFGKKTAAKLRKLRKVSLMLRLVVRNASSRSPLSTTVLSTVNLSR